tara:strand:+ start:857 stop:1537 length:681 start_codon:yes stop_codon:yes gene_type:complete
MIKQMTTVASLGVLLSACSASNPFVSANTANIKTKPPIGVVKSMYEHQANKVKQQVAEVPKWYTKMPVKDDAIYAVGTANTPDLQLSNDIAILSAKTTLADRINGRVNSITKSFITKVGSTDADAAVMNEIQTATKNIISDVDVAGYNVQESKVVSNGTQYRVYVLLEYSDENAQKILLNRLKKDKMLLSKIKSNEAFKELDESVNKSKVDEIKKLDKIIEAEKLS